MDCINLPLQILYNQKFTKTSSIKYDISNTVNSNFNYESIYSTLIDILTYICSGSETSQYSSVYNDFYTVLNNAIPLK